MIKSMTAYGRGAYADEKRTVTVEVKSVNHRYSDITVKIPRRFIFAEDTVKSLVKGFAPRGKVEVLVTVDSLDGDDTDIQLSIPLAQKYYEKFTELKAAFPDLSGDVNLRMLAGMPDVIKGASNDEDEEAFIDAITKATNEAGEAFTNMRSIEGEKLYADILSRLDTIETALSRIEKRAPEVQVIYTNKFKERIQSLVGDNVEVPQDRILLEAAIFADKADITEEIVRLKSHIGNLRQKRDANGPVGKDLDFYVQEMNRESNTIMSKARDIDITEDAIILKSEIEKIREQIQNIE